MLREGQPGGWKPILKGVVRFIATYCVFALTRILIMNVAMSIGIPSHQLQGTAAISFFVAIFVAWRFVWKAKMWQEAPEKDLDTSLDAE